MTCKGQFRVYLAGPITGMTMEEASGWRNLFKHKLPERIECLDPLRGKPFLAGEMDIKDSYDDQPLGDRRAILTRDYFDCKRSDLIVANFLDAKRVSIGTVMELAWAKAFDIPTIVIMEEGNIHDHAMVVESAGFIVDTVEAAIELTQHILLAD